ncbi:DUF6055 domain-containing protein [Treponema zioleckii]|uniref:DUF6055 domain-containing protein n=1 Tax=Treponema zioleckii TaxID=331680 RepID=UPI00168BA17A|nr:DUF6055 domain-containing protein [Treponema zioleckii]
MKITNFKYFVFAAVLFCGCSFTIQNENESENESELSQVDLGITSPSFKVYSNPARVNSPADIQDYGKYYKPASFNFDMFNANSKYSWHRFKQSEHFFVFWEKPFGSNPNSSSLPYEMRVDVDDLLAKAEEFYNLNVNTLKMCTTGYGISNLDKYKLQIYLVYQKEWLATGSGYDNVIGALWVNPSTCKPVGKTIAHEIGHTFQYQIYCDRLLTGAANNYKYGWRYGFGPNGSGGNGFWEQSAQFQAYQLYPQQAFEQNYYLFTKNTHRHFNDESMRYQSFWFMYYFTNKYGIESFSNLWKYSSFPEDPLEAYTRLICNGNWERTWNDYYEYASHAVTYDFGKINANFQKRFATYNTNLIQLNKKFRPAYSSCPSTSGFNIIKLKNPAKNTRVTANLDALAVGSELCANDKGEVVNSDGKVIGTTRNYNNNIENGVKHTDSNFRLGFVGIKNSKPVYGEMAKGKSAQAFMDVTEDFDEFYLVVLASPQNYTHHFWNDTEADDLQWPYELYFENTAPFANPNDGNVAFGVYCNPQKKDYVLGELDFSAIEVIKKLAVNFNLSEQEVKNCIIQPQAGKTIYPQEGKIILALTEPNGNLNLTPTATTGFWCDKNGYVQNWGAKSNVFFEYDPKNAKLTYGHLPGFNNAGDTIIVKPTFVYTKNGQTYKTTISFYYIFK